MMDYAEILACIRSGQLTDDEIAEHMKDPAFAEYWRAHTSEAE